MVFFIKCCSYVLLGGFGLMTIIPNIMIGDNGSIYKLRVSQLALCGSWCMISSGIINMPIVGIVGIGLQLTALALL